MSIIISMERGDGTMKKCMSTMLLTMGEAYKGYGVDADSGYVVIVRPDQYVGWVGELEDLQDMGRYFSEILIPKN